jgi:uncharacterized membrane protein YfcA
VQAIALGLVACLAGAINAVAGGGSLLTFPALLWLGRDPIVANATNTITLWPGSLAAALALRRDLRGARAWLALFLLPCVAGAVAGALLLLSTPSRVFAAMVPYLILFATALFAVQGPLTTRLAAARRRRASRMSSPAPSDADISSGIQAPSGVPAPSGAQAPSGVQAMPAIGGTATLAVLLFQFAVAVYGGYFGAGIGILTLAALGLAGFTDIHQMIGMRNVNAVWINGVAGLCFVFAGVIRWPDAVVLTIGQVIGGYAGARLARRLAPPLVRRAVVLIGIAMAGSLFFARR